jgi:hypothetical protein
MGQVLEAALPAVAANGADATTLLGVISGVGGTDNLTYKLSLTPPPGFTTVAGDATDRARFTFQTKRGSTTTTLGTLDLTTGSLVAETTVAVPISEARPSLQSPNDLVEVVIHQLGAGHAIGAGIVAQVEME